MPQVVNGCGTWYYGKNRVHRIAMTCPNCGAYADLESYDTTKYIVFVFVPLIPISKWRVLEKCPSCTQHRAIKLKDWEASKRADSAAVTGELRQDKENPETVQKVLAVATVYQDENLFLQVAEALAKPMTHDADVQASLGAAYAYFARRDQSEEAYKASLAVKDDPEVGQQLALQLLRQGRPEEAEKYLQHALEGGEVEQAGFVHLLGEGYLASGQSDRGIELLDKAAEMDPSIKADTHHQKLRQRADKSRTTGRAIPSPLLTPSKKSGYEEGGVGRHVAAWVGPLVAVVLLAFYLSLAWSNGRSREVHVVSGLDVPYTATIAGETVELQPRGRTTIQVAEGTLHVTATAGDKPIGAADVQIKTSFFLRPFLSRTFVINPDKAALLVWEKQFYAENPANAPDAESELLTGEAVYEFQSIDYEFTSFPAQIEMSSSSGSIGKTRVSVLADREVPDTDLPFILPTILAEDTYRDFVATRARFAPDDEMWVFVLQTLMSEQDYLAFLQADLDDRPLHVNWHRAYQTVMEQHDPDHDLAAEYQQYLQGDPENGSLLYLAGRVTKDLDEAEALYRRATQADPPSPFAANALAFQLIGEGKFEEALPLTEQAVAADPQSLTFDAIHRSTLLATGRYDELIDRVRRKTEDSVIDLLRVSQETQLLGYKGDGAAARRQIEQYSRQQLQQGDAALSRQVKDALLASLAYTEGDVETYLKTHADDVEPTFEVLFVRGDLAAATAAAKAEEASSEAAARHLAISLKARHSGNDELAERELAAGIESLRSGSSEQRQFADALSPEGTSAPDRLLRVPMLPVEKRIVLAALGVRYPEDRDAYFPLARKLNFERSVPWAFLQEFLGEQP